MTKFFDIDAANEALIEVGPLLATLSDQRPRAVETQVHLSVLLPIRRRWYATIARWRPLARRSG